MSHFLRSIAVLLLFSTLVFGQPAGKTRTYFIAADEVDWDYAPGGVNKMMGMKFEGYSKTFVEKAPIASARCIAKPYIASTPMRLSDS